MKNNLFKIIIISLFLGFLPYNSVFAMKLFVMQPVEPVKVGDTVLIKLMLDTDKKEINAIDAKITVDGTVKIPFTNVGGSIFNLWPNKPSISGGEISFIGGTPSGVFGNNLKVIEFAINPQKVGKIKVSTNPGSFALLNDGLGTKVNLDLNFQEIVVNTAGPEVNNEIEGLLLSDKNPPESFKIELGKDIKSYDNKYFLSFYTDDKDSGLNRYEILEGDNPLIRSGSVYILRDQDLKTDVKIMAIDNAGNIRTEVFRAPKGKSQFVLIIFVIAIIMIALLFFKKFKKR